MFKSIDAVLKNFGETVWFDPKGDNQAVTAIVRRAAKEVDMDGMRIGSEDMIRLTFSIADVPRIKQGDQFWLSDDSFWKVKKTEVDAAGARQVLLWKVNRHE